MTRETKAGLVVSCSFLCLVGVVLFAKMKERNTETTLNPEHSVAVTAPPEPVKLPAEEKANPATDRQLADASGLMPAKFPLEGERGTTGPAPGGALPDPAIAKEPT